MAHARGAAAEVRRRVPLPARVLLPAVEGAVLGAARRGSVLSQREPPQRSPERRTMRPERVPGIRSTQP